MMSTAQKALLAIRTNAFVTGLMGNIFILYVNVIAWFKSNSDLSVCDLINSILALSNIGQLCAALFYQINTIFSQTSLALRWIQLVLDPISVFFRSCSLWCSTWFCVYCCLKIVNFTQPLVVRMVTRIQENISRLLLGSLLISLASCVPIAVQLLEDWSSNGLANRSMHASDDVSGNASTSGLSSHWAFNREQTPYFTILALIFAIFVFSAVAILITLCRHMRRMGQNADAFRSPSLDAHLGAVKTVSSLLILYSVFYLVQIVTVFGSNVSYRSPLLYACYILMDYVPVLNAIILILQISRFRKTLDRIFPFATCSGIQST